MVKLRDLARPGVAPTPQKLTFKALASRVKLGVKIGLKSEDEILNTEAEEQEVEMALSEMFRRADVDDNGLINFSELCTSVRDNQLEITRQELQVLFTKYDRDGETGLDEKEFKQMVRESGKCEHGRRSLAHATDAIRRRIAGGSGSGGLRYASVYSILCNAHV